jgi:hypothetical protein
MTTQNPDWLTVGAKVAIVSTGRSTGTKAISFDTIETIDPQSIHTAKGHKFDIETLATPVGRHDMYLWRIADPDSPETKLGVAIQAREKSYRAVHKHQARLDRDPTNTDIISILLEALTQYKAFVLQAESLIEASKATA